ncbi:MAG: HAMP domain-containing histidine kinase [Bdellovibrionaceae bacterium]|nr:HAMP domain-containing histidine kinase [Bdellovibrionales bacterium]MCB9083014.1 HAMP domain-containing histidine kinase [Pseudobdellovibrionaceae bacterium]
MKTSGQRKSLIRFLLLFLVCLSLPMIFLGYLLNSYFERQAYQDVRTEAEAINEFTLDRLSELVRSEDLRPFTEYSFSYVQEIGLSYFLSVSPLAKIEPETGIPGVIGYFQIDDDGRFTSPVWPLLSAKQSSQLNDPRARREKLFQIYDTLKSAELLNPKAQRDHAFFKLREKMNLTGESELRDLSVTNTLAAMKGGSLEELELVESKFAPSKKSMAVTKKSKSSYGIQEAKRQMRIKGMDAVVYPFQSVVLNTGHILFYREVLVRKQSYYQGFLVDEAKFFAEVIRPRFRKGLSEDKQDQVVVASGERILPSFTEANKRKGQQVLILEQTLHAPFDDLRFFYSTAGLKVSKERWLVNGVLFVFFLILSGGLVWFYFLNKKQLELVQRQSDFVSAVSHELRTPLTSIRMHSEMLRFGWVKDEDKKQESYSYILTESERLSRLINNVLSMARIGREQLVLNCEVLPTGEALDFVVSRVLPQVENSGFELRVNRQKELSGEVSVDRDALLQIVMNLVDNGLKFARDCEPKVIEIIGTVEDDHLVIGVRDYGPGVHGESEDKIFDLFYRQENELTRSTTGTGIGLALVKQLSELMKAQVSYEKARPGACFLVSLPFGSRS